MRTIAFGLVCLLAACSGDNGATRSALCAFCDDDSQCGGNPCFQDVSGSRFCGAPCDACPTGYSCQTVMGTTGLQQTCFPDSEACTPTGSVGSADLSSSGGDGGPSPSPSPSPSPNPGGIPVGGAVGATGGTVDRLYFGFTGDTRPAQCNAVYPDMIIRNIFTGMGKAGVQFALDQGDHMFNCTSGSTGFADARDQMQHYVDAARLLGKTVFMTMGNHECSYESQSLCSVVNSYGTNPNYTAFLDALAPISPKPYYRFDVKTKSGLAVFIVVADDTWDATQQAWLKQQLTDADAHAKYTFVSTHHPNGNTDHPEFQQIYDLVTSHKYTLFLTGHSHLFRREYGDPRTMVIGTGGAPLASGTYWGYGTALQGTDDRIYVTIYDQATGNVTDRFDVGPQ